MKLLENRWVHVLWCDDIRQELGNKTSFMGVYTGALVVPTLPAMVPRLAIWLDICTPESKPFKSLRVRLFSNDMEKPLAEMVFPPEQLTDAAARSEEARKKNASEADEGDELRGMKLSFAMLLGQVRMSERARWLKVFVETEAETLESLKLRVTTSDDRVVGPLPEPTANFPKAAKKK